MSGSLQDPLLLLGISFRIRYLLLKKSCCFFDLYIKDSIINTILVNDVSSQSHHLHTNVTYLHLCKGWINFQTPLCDSSISSWGGEKYSNFCRARGRRNFFVNLYLDDTLEIFLSWILEKSRNRISLFFHFFFSCHSIITIEFVSYWKKYKENRFFYNYTLKFFSNKIISIIVQYITRLSSCRFNSTSLHPSLFTYICIYTLFYIFHP